jgi:arsenite-transporting ATPase
VPGLRVLQVDAAARLREWRDGSRAEARELVAAAGPGGPLLDRNILDALWDAVPPGIDELFALSEIMDAAETGELIIVDAAPTGHFLRLLESPGVALEWTHAVLRMVLRYHAAGALGDFSERMLAFARQLKHLRAMFSDPAASGVFVVTLEEPVVGAQTDRLTAALRAADVPVIGHIVNRARRSSVAGMRAPAGVLTLRAPDLPSPPTGVQELERFLAQWELA